MDIRPRTPAEPEQADGDETAADDGWRKTGFRRYVAVLVESGFEVFVHPPVVGWDGDKSGNEDTEESEA